jgi:predicted nucleotidyltransferase
MVSERIRVSPDAIAEFCTRNHIRKLSLFGSVLRDDFRPDSDVDVLVEFEPGHVPGFMRIVALEIELSELLEWKVDLRTPAEISHYFRQHVVDTAQVVYAA